MSTAPCIRCGITMVVDEDYDPEDAGVCTDCDDQLYAQYLRDRDGDEPETCRRL